MNIDHIKKYIVSVPFRGIDFKNIFPIFYHHEAVSELVDHLYEHIISLDTQIDAIVGIDARGFLLGPLLAMKLKCRFAPARKKSKLPGKRLVAEYKKEYGTDSIEMEIDAIKENQNVIILDDVIATGGTAKATADLVLQLGGKIVEFLFIVELESLKGREMLSLIAPCYAAITYD